MIDVEIVRGIAQPLSGSPGDYEALLELIGDARIVLLGEASHGTRRILLRVRGNYETRVVEPLERISIWDEGELDP
jgi:hypothetical protein